MSTTEIGVNLVNDILIETRVQLVADRLTAPRWLIPEIQGVMSNMSVLGVMSAGGYVRGG